MFKPVLQLISHFEENTWGFVRKHPCLFFISITDRLKHSLCYRCVIQKWHFVRSTIRIIQVAELLFWTLSLKWLFLTLIILFSLLLWSEYCSGPQPTALFSYVTWKQRTFTDTVKQKEIIFILFYIDQDSVKVHNWGSQLQEKKTQYATKGIEIKYRLTKENKNILKLYSQQYS